MRLSWFRRGAGRRPPRPSWAVFLTDPEWAEFLQTLELVIAERGFEATRSGDVMAVRAGGGEAPVDVGLRPLAQRCAAAEPGRWPEVIGAHLEGLVRGRREVRNLDRGRFAGVRDLLRLRLYPEAVLASDPGLRLVHEPVAEGIIAALVLDAPHALVSVPAEDLVAWGEPRERVWALAREQTRETPAHREVVEVARDLHFEARHGASFLVASQLLFGLGRDRERPRPEPFGRIVAVPTCHLLLAHSVRDARVLLALQALAAQALLSYHQGPGSIAPHLYWQPERSEELVRLPTEVSRKGITFRPPDEFVRQVMLPLGAEDAAPGDGH